MPDVDPSVLEQIYLDIDKAKLDAEDYADTGLAGKSDIGHTHTKSDITDFAHNHDDRYYTESEMDTFLDGKSDTGHNHPKNEINDLIIDILPSEENRMDLNDYIDYGLYRMPNRANWDYVDNFPDIPKLSSGFAFLLDVENGINAERTDPCRQTLTIHDVSDPRIFYRVLRKWDTQDTHVYNWSDWCEISKTGHNHDERYYTETEVNQIVTDLKKLFLNRLILGSINDSLQIDESMDIVAQLIVNGIPSENETIYFYEKLQAI